MSKHTPDLFARAAAFYEGQPTGQYDTEAAHALRCHHDLLEALKNMVQLDEEEHQRGPGDIDICQEVQLAYAAIAKATEAA